MFVDYITIGGLLIAFVGVQGCCGETLVRFRSWTITCILSLRYCHMPKIKIDRCSRLTATLPVFLFHKHFFEEFSIAESFGISVTISPLHILGSEHIPPV